MIRRIASLLAATTSRSSNFFPRNTLKVFVTQSARYQARQAHDGPELFLRQSNRLHYNQPSPFAPARRDGDLARLRSRSARISASQRHLLALRSTKYRVRFRVRLPVFFLLPLLLDNAQPAQRFLARLRAAKLLASQSAGYFPLLRPLIPLERGRRRCAWRDRRRSWHSGNARCRCSYGRGRRLRNAARGRGRGDGLEPAGNAI
jgi:hypothetical protein